MVGDAEELVHGLQRQTLGLGHEEPDEEEHGETEASEDEICAVFTNQSETALYDQMAWMGHNSPITVRTDSHEHGRHSPGDNEVEEPLGGRGIRNVHGSETGSWDLGGVDPACWAPAELEEPVVR